jgi:glycosyltransferase involved in cell wall biosynthesis
MRALPGWQLEGNEILISDNSDKLEVREANIKTALQYGIVYKYNGENIGAEKNYIECVKWAKGDYVWLLGDDDIIVGSLIQNLYQHLRDGVYGLMILPHHDMEEKRYANYQEFIKLKSLSCPKYLVTHCTWISGLIFKRSLFNIGFAESQSHLRYMIGYTLAVGLASASEYEQVWTNGQIRLVDCQPNRPTFAVPITMPELLNIQADLLTFIAGITLCPGLDAYADKWRTGYSGDI